MNTLFVRLGLKAVLAGLPLDPFGQVFEFGPGRVRFSGAGEHVNLPASATLYASVDGVAVGVLTASGSGSGHGGGN